MIMIVNLRRVSYPRRESSAGAGSGETAASSSVEPCEQMYEFN